MVKPQARRAAVCQIQDAHGLSERRAFGQPGIERSSLRYEPREKDDEALRERLTELARMWRRASCLGQHRHFRHGDWDINHKPVYRIYRAMGLHAPCKANIGDVCDEADSSESVRRTLISEFAVRVRTWANSRSDSIDLNVSLPAVTAE